MSHAMLFCTSSGETTYQIRITKEQSNASNGNMRQARHVLNIDDGSGGHMRTKNVIHQEKQVARNSC